MIMRDLNPFATHSTRKVFREVADQHDMVCFGRVDQQDDEHKLVRGVTLSPTHKDDHYCIGSIAGRDAIFLERTDTITRPNGSMTSYTWTILSIDLKYRALPHVVIDAGHHDAVFYEQFFTKFFQFVAADGSIFNDKDATFAKRFKVYSTPDVVDTLPVLLPHDVTTVIGHHFSHFNFEVFDDTLIVYTPHTKTTKHLLDHMIHAGLWFADEIEKSAHALGAGQK